MCDDEFSSNTTSSYYTQSVYTRIAYVFNLILLYIQVCRHTHWVFLNKPQIYKSPFIGGEKTPSAIFSWYYKCNSFQNHKICHHNHHRFQFLSIYSIYIYIYLYVHTLFYYLLSLFFQKQNFLLNLIKKK